MSILKALQEGKLPPFDQLPLDRLPPAIKGKVCFIAKLIDQATLFLKAKQTFPEKVSVDSFLNGSNAPEDSQDELSKILNELFKPTFSKENDDFDTYLNKLQARPKLIFEILKIINEESPKCVQRILNSLNEGQTQSSKEESEESLSYSEYIKLMCNPEYEPGNELTRLVEGLQQLLFYWVTWPDSQIEIGIAISHDLVKTADNNLARLQGKGFEPTIERLKGIRDKLAGPQGIRLGIEEIKVGEAALDLSLTKIAYQVGEKATLIRQWGRREGNRTLGSAKARQEKKVIDAQPVIKTFHSLKFPREVFPKGASLNKVAEMIKNILKNDSPSIDTIKRVLKNDEEIWKQFKEIKVKGRNHFIKQT